MSHVLLLKTGEVKIISVAGHWGQACGGRVRDNKLKLSASVSTFVLCCLLMGCSWGRKTAPSILIIAVDQLGYENLPCEADPNAAPPEAFKEKGLEQLCRESVRFTHAFTPSLMNEASIASLLTGKTPLLHGVFHNGNKFLPAEVETVSEVALKNKFRTSFFSGGPPVWSQSGIAQGFEVFNDQVPARLGSYYLPAQKNLARFLSWLDSDVGSNAFFSMVYLPDLQFRNQSTVTNEGLARAKGFQGQLQEVSESLGELIQGLKIRHRWDSTYVFLVGLSSYGNPNQELGLNATSLRAEKMQVALMVKPKRKPRDEAVQWTIDKNVSFSDIGATLSELVKSEVEDSEPNSGAVSLVPSLVGSSAPWNQKRSLLLESSWPLWRGIGTTRFAVRKGDFLVVHDQETLAFNTLTDRLESSPLQNTDPGWGEWVGPAIRYMENRGLEKWAQVDRASREKVAFAKTFFSTDEKSSYVKQLRRLVDRSPDDIQLSGWLARTYIDLKKWDELMQLGIAMNEPVWTFVGARRKGVPAALKAEGCERLFLPELWEEADLAETCDDSTLIYLIQWIRSEDPYRFKDFEPFFKRYMWMAFQRRVGELNYQNDLLWDVNLSDPARPTLSELFLALPEWKKYRKILSQSLNQIKN